MANVTRKLPAQDHRYPVGTSVSLYHATAKADRTSGAPSGSPVATATVAADGSLTFSSVPDDNGVGYVMWSSSAPASYVKIAANPAVSWASRH